MPQARDTVEASRPLAAQIADARIDAPASFLIMRGVVKRFGTAAALNGVNLTVGAGEIHALLGENGAGKSTLMHILAGLLTPDAGEICLNASLVHVRSPLVARRIGIAMVHQHFTLVPAFTVEENLALNIPASGIINRLRYTPDRIAADALCHAEMLGWTLPAKSRVADLPVGTQQRVEIVKALATEARLLIFDEPTAVLSAEEITELFAVLRRLRDEGKTVILIAHKLAEILAVADRVTVLRRGVVVGTCDVADTNAEKLAVWMVGPDVPTVESASDIVASSAAKAGKSSNTPKSAAVSNGDRTIDSLPNKTSAAKAMLTARDISVRGDRGEQSLRGLSLSVKPGEIFGIGGVDGNGQTELAEALAGLRHLESGSLTWAGEVFRPSINPSTGYIPQDRRRAGMAITMSIEDNLLFEAVHDHQYRFGPFLKRRELTKLANDLIQQFDIRTADARLPASSLSGGNQQKIVVARALHSEPEWIVAVNPTRGLDIGATRFVHRQLHMARARGAAIVLISTDRDELAALADRTAILSNGTLSSAQSGFGDATQLGLLLGGVNTKDSQRAENSDPGVSA